MCKNWKESKHYEAGLFTESPMSVRQLTDGRVVHPLTFCLLSWGSRSHAALDNWRYSSQLAKSGTHSSSPLGHATGVRYFLFGMKTVPHFGHVIVSNSTRRISLGRDRVAALLQMVFKAAGTASMLIFLRES
jgi:hypothetical protein